MKTTDEKHTPTPLKESGTTQIINQEHEETVTEIVTTDFREGLTIGYIYPEYSAFIVGAVNLHERAMNAIKDAREMLEKMTNDSAGADVLYNEMTEILEDAGEFSSGSFIAKSEGR